MVSPKGYGDGAVAMLCSVRAGSSGGGGTELDDGVSLCATGPFPLSRLKPDRSPCRDSVPAAGYGIPVEHRSAFCTCVVLGWTPVS